MSGWIAGLLWRVRYPACAVILLGFVVLAPSTNFTELDNDISAWISKTDPVYQTYERFRAEFGGGRPLIVALKSDRLFTRESLEFIRDVTEDIRRVDTVERVQSLSTANIVEALPPRPDDEGGIEVRPLLDDLDKPGAPDVARRRALDDPLLRGDLVSDDGTVTAIVVTFDEDRIDQVRAGVIEMIHKLVDPRLPPGMEAFYNGSLEISETYNRVTLDNTRKLIPPVLLLTIAGIYVMFRSWRLTFLVVVSMLVSVVWTMGLFVLMGFKYNVLASMLPALIVVLAIADDLHIVQHFIHELRDTGDRRHAFLSSVEHLFVPLLGASATTALGLASLATSDVVAVRTFGIGAAVGVMVDFVMSLVFVPTLLTLVNAEPVPPPQERWLVAPMRAVARFSIAHARLVLIVSLVVAVVAMAGMTRLHVDTNHINFFSERHPLHRSADVIDRELSGVYSFNVLLEGPPDSMKSPDALRRMERLQEELRRLPFVRKVVSVADYVKQVNRELHGGGKDASVVPPSAEAIAQELFVFGLSDDGRIELERIVASDYSRAQMPVKLASMSSDLVFEQINRAEVLAAEVFAGSGLTTTITGSGRMFATLDHYLVVSQLSSFATAFITVFAVIFVLFRSARFGLLAVIANAVPVLAVLGLMGWMDISLNVATIMVASVALGIVDDDTIHFIGRYRRDAARGVGTEEAIEIATVHEGRASLTTAIINSLGYGIMVFSEYRPTAWFGGLLALTLAVAFIAEVFVVPAVITFWPKIYGAPRIAQRIGSAA
ncbi:MAG TPA: MMPL family transporter [Vicinamibacterales bacterium]|nr:MMPL family transporter [Vicinamibacterales bacterium]